MGIMHPVRSTGSCFVAAIHMLAAVSLQAQTVPTDSITGRIHEIPDITVSARRTPPAITATSPLQVMGKAEMERLGLHDVADAVRHFSGVSVKD